VRAARVALPSRLPADLLGGVRCRREPLARRGCGARHRLGEGAVLSGHQPLGADRRAVGELVEAPADRKRDPSVGAAVRLPILEGGRLRGTLAARDADYDLAVEQYNQTLSDALREVVDSSPRCARWRRSVAKSRPPSPRRKRPTASRSRVTRRHRQPAAGVTAEMQVLEQRTLRTELLSRELTLSIA